MNHLNTDTLYLIIEEIYSQDAQSVPSLRLVSRQFDGVAKRYPFRSITFNPAKLEKVALIGETLVRNIQSHLRHVIIRTNVDWKALIELLTGCEGLAVMTWHFLDGDSIQYFPSQLRHAIEDEWPQIHLVVKDIPILMPPFCTAVFLHAEGGRIGPSPTECLRNRRGEVFTTQTFDRQLWIPSKELQAWIRGRPYSELSISADSFPRVKSFTLEQDFWPCSFDKIADIWDFSRVEELTIEWCTFGFLLAFAHPSSLQRLKLLNIDYNDEHARRRHECDVQISHQQNFLALNHLRDCLPRGQLKVLVFNFRVPSEIRLAAWFQPLLGLEFCTFAS